MPRPGEDERNSDEFLIQLGLQRGRSVPHEAVIKEFFTMISREHDQSLAEQALVFEDVDHRSEQPVNFPNLGIIELVQHLFVAFSELCRSERHDGSVQDSSDRGSFFQFLSRSRKKIVTRIVGLVDDGGVIEDEKRLGSFAVQVLCEPVQELVAGFPTEIPSLYWRQTQVHVVGSEGEEIQVGHLVPSLPQELGQSDEVRGAHPVAIVHLVRGRIEPAQKGDQSRCRPGGGAVRISKDGSSPGPGIDVWTGIPRVSVDAKSVGPTGVDAEDKQIAGKERLAARQDQSDPQNKYLPASIQHPESGI